MAWVSPRDRVEAMLAAQMAVVHLATMTFSRRLACTETIAVARLGAAGAGPGRRGIADQRQTALADAARGQGQHEGQRSRKCLSYPERLFLHQ
jgi:hypothetical protein